MARIDLLLVNPGSRLQMYGRLGSTFSGIEPPLWCGLTAAFVRKYGYTVRIIDADAEDLSPELVADKIVEEEPVLVDIVVMGINPSASSTPKMTAVRETVNALRARATGINIILSGLHPSALPERTLREEQVDFVCQGEGFYTIRDLVKALTSGRGIEEIKGLWYRKNGDIVFNGPSELVKDLDEIPFIAWDLLPMDKYRAHNWHCFENLRHRKPYAAIYTGLGCPFNCSYCNIHALYNDRPGIRYRSPEKVVEEIGLLVKDYGIRNLKIADELFVLNEERVNRICDMIIEAGYKLNIWAYARVDTINKPILKKMKEAGVNWLCFGIESADRGVLEGVSKRIAEKNIENAIEMVKNAGIYVIGNFLFGLPDDNLETMKATLNLAKKLNCEYVNFYVVMAYPGSKLYKDALEKGVRLPERWHGYTQLSEDTLPLPTKYIGARDVLIFRDQAFYDYFSSPRYLEMIQNKFGQEVVRHIREMLKHRIKRRYV